MNTTSYQPKYIYIYIFVACTYGFFFFFFFFFEEEHVFKVLKGILNRQANVCADNGDEAKGESESRKESSLDFDKVNKKHKHTTMTNKLQGKKEEE